MRLGFKATLLSGVAMLAVWHGVLLAVPHNHGDTAVPQEKLACSASHPLSQTSHLHSAGHLLDHHACLACFAGTSGATASGLENLAIIMPSDSLPTMPPGDCRAQIHSHLPLLRGPPQIV
jgi:hypothetical protein